MTEGGCLNNVTTFHQNPQFFIQLEDSDDDDDLCTCVIALMRKNYRQDSENVIYIGNNTLTYFPINIYSVTLYRTVVCK